MFKLYGNVANSWKKIDIAINESEIVDTMIACSNKLHLYNYKIEEVANKKKKTTIINNKEELAEYLYQYKERIKPLEDMSCVNLKRYILKKKDNKK